MHPSPAPSRASPTTAEAKQGQYLQLVHPLLLDGPDYRHYALRPLYADRGFLQLGHLRAEPPTPFSDAPGIPRSSPGTDALQPPPCPPSWPRSPSSPPAPPPGPRSPALFPKPCSLGTRLTPARCSPTRAPATPLPSPAHAPWNPRPRLPAPPPRRPRLRGSRAHHRVPFRAGQGRAGPGPRSRGEEPARGR